MLESVSVLNSYRRHGIAKLMLARLLEDVRSTSSDHVVSTGAQIDVVGAQVPVGLVGIFASLGFRLQDAAELELKMRQNSELLEKVWVVRSLV
jgi:N-acetylglutamate synthase-like GNAT family acetyltransferase